jgi:hypothetical protein
VAEKSGYRVNGDLHFCSPFFYNLGHVLSTHSRISVVLSVGDECEQIDQQTQHDENNAKHNGFSGHSLCRLLKKN